MNEQLIEELRAMARGEAVSTGVLTRAADALEAKPTDAMLDAMRRSGLSIDGDNAYKRDLLDCVIGALAFGKQGVNPPPAGHWAQQFWEMGNAERLQQQEELARRDDAGHNLRELFKRGAAALGLEPDETSWFEIVGELEKLTAPRDFPVPEGYALVPLEPTPEMLDEIHLVEAFSRTALAARYAALLAVAPAAPAVQINAVSSDFARDLRKQDAREAVELQTYLFANCLDVRPSDASLFAWALAALNAKQVAAGYFCEPFKDGKFEQVDPCCVGDLDVFPLYRITDTTKTGPVVAPDGFTVERDLFGAMHIKLGDFDFIQIQYQYPITDNASTRALAEKIVGLLSSRAFSDVLVERQRQVSVEDFDAGHDDMATRGQIAMAAGLYALDAAGLSAGRASLSHPSSLWPWPEEWWKPAGARRNLIKAGALILAEIERLDRAAAREVKP